MSATDFRIANPEGRDEWAYGKAGNQYIGTAGHPLGLRKMKTRERVRDTKAQGGSFTPVLETPMVGSKTGMRPRVMNDGSKGTKAKTVDGGP